MKKSDYKCMIVQREKIDGNVDFMNREKVCEVTCLMAMAINQRLFILKCKKWKIFVSLPLIMPNFLMSKSKERCVQDVTTNNPVGLQQSCVHLWTSYETSKHAYSRYFGVKSIHVFCNMLKMHFVTFSVVTF